MSFIKSELERIFALGLEMASSEDRRALLDRECGSNVELISELEQLFAASKVRGDFLDTAIFRPLVVPGLIGTEPAWTLSKQALQDSIPGETIGGNRKPTPRTSTTLIGRYRPLQSLGSGGMGTVWLAQLDEPFARQVAIKVLNSSMQSPEFIARFETERMTLARLDHPGIARILDGGVDSSGAPYFVMEYVPGLPLIDYCVQKQLAFEKRCQLFCDVCRAVHFAHRQRVIHRDLKPANILVQEIDGRAVPRIIDFGVSLSVPEERSTATESDEVISGTLAYMAPEQARFASSVDARSDVYSLGCILYELLAEQPFRNLGQLRSISRLDALNFIVNQQPSRPSEASFPKSADNASQASAIARKSRLRGEPDWIVEKCLQNDPDLRYDSAKELLDDIERCLNDQPILAAPRSWYYPLGKLVLRHRGIAGALLVAGIAICCGIATGVVGLWEAQRALRAERVAADQFREERDRANLLREEAVLHAIAAEEQRKIADEQRLLAELSADFLQNDLLLQADPSHRANHQRSPTIVWQPGPNPSATQLIDRAAERLQPDTVAKEISDRPLVFAQLLSTLGMSYVGVGEFARAVSVLQRSIELQQTLVDADDLAFLETRNRLARALLGSGKAADAAEISRDVAERRSRVLGPSHQDVLISKTLQGWAMQNSGNFAAALAVFDEISPAFDSQFGPESVLTLGMLNNRAIALQQLGRSEEAMELIRSVSDRRHKILGPDHPDTLYSDVNLAGMQMEQGELPEAISTFEEAGMRFRSQYPPDHPTLLTCLNNLALAYEKSGRTADSVRILRDVVAAKEIKLSPEHPSVLISVSNLALSLQASDNIVEALTLFERARTGLHATLPPEHPLCLAADTNWGSCLSAAGRHEEAIDSLRQSLAQKEMVHGKDHPSTVYTLSHLGMALQVAGQAKEAVEKLQAAFDRQSADLGQDHPDTLATQWSLSRALAAIGDREAALKLYGDLLKRQQQILGRDHPLVQKVLKEYQQHEDASVN